MATASSYAIFRYLQNLELLHSQVQAIQSKLDLYQDLPANMPMAKLKLQTIKNEIVSTWHRASFRFSVVVSNDSSTCFDRSQAAIDRRIEERMNLMS